MAVQVAAIVVVLTVLAGHGFAYRAAWRDTPVSLRRDAVRRVRRAFRTLDAELGAVPRPRRSGRRARGLAVVAAVAAAGVAPLVERASWGLAGIDGTTLADERAILVQLLTVPIAFLVLALSFLADARSLFGRMLRRTWLLPAFFFGIGRDCPGSG